MTNRRHKVTNCTKDVSCLLPSARFLVNFGMVWKPVRSTGVDYKILLTRVIRGHTDGSNTALIVDVFRNIADRVAVTDILGDLPADVV